MDTFDLKQFLVENKITFQSRLNEELSDKQIITILKKYEDPESEFYKTNFSDYLIDIKGKNYEGTPKDLLTTEKKVISDYKKWKQSGY